MNTVSLAEFKHDIPEVPFDPHIYSTENPEYIRGIENTSILACSESWLEGKSENISYYYEDMLNQYVKLALIWSQVKQPGHCLLRAEPNQFWNLARLFLPEVCKTKSGLVKQWPHSTFNFI